eukprot:gene8528-11528_t
MNDESKEDAKVAHYRTKVNKVRELALQTLHRNNEITEDQYTQHKAIIYSNLEGPELDKKLGQLYGPRRNTIVEKVKAKTQEIIKKLQTKQQSGSQGQLTSNNSETTTSSDNLNQMLVNSNAVQPIAQISNNQITANQPQIQLNPNQYSSSNPLPKPLTNQNTNNFNPNYMPAIPGPSFDNYNNPIYPMPHLVNYPNQAQFNNYLPTIQPTFMANQTANMNNQTIPPINQSLQYNNTMRQQQSTYSLPIPPQPQLPTISQSNQIPLWNIPASSNMAINQNNNLIPNQPLNLTQQNMNYTNNNLPNPSIKKQIIPPIPTPQPVQTNNTTGEELMSTSEFDLYLKSQKDAENIEEGLDISTLNTNTSVTLPTLYPSFIQQQESFAKNQLQSIINTSVPGINNYVMPYKQNIYQGFDWQMHSIVDKTMITNACNTVTKSNNTPFTMSQKAQEALSKGLQQHLKAVLEKSFQVNKKRRHLPTISSYNKIQAMIEREGNGYAIPENNQNIGILWGLDIQQKLEHEESYAKNVVVQYNKKEEERIIAELKAADEEVKGSKRSKNENEDWWTRDEKNERNGNFSLNELSDHHFKLSIAQKYEMGPYKKKTTKANAAAAASTSQSNNNVYLKANEPSEAAMEVDISKEIDKKPEKQVCPLQSSNTASLESITKEDILQVLTYRVVHKVANSKLPINRISQVLQKHRFSL